MSRIARLIVALATTAACAPTSVGTPAATATSAASLRIGLVEWDIVVPAATLSAGEVTLVVTNAGSTAHDLHITGDIPYGAVALLQPGQQQVMRLQLPAGERLQLWCSVPGHRAQGMQATIVTG